MVAPRKGPKTRLASRPGPSNRIRWNFPPTGGGVSQGFNDSGEEFFRANVMAHVVREIIQNSLDAKDPRYPDKPVIVRMELIDLTPAMIGGSGLAKHVAKAVERTTSYNHTQGTKFYEEALRILKKAKIPTLKIVDENTTGLTDSKWDALVYQEGTPNKEGIGAAGGSFGIGKNAPYVASKLRLVCYSTRYLDRNRVEKFIARCRLVAHTDPLKSSRELQHVGFGTSKPLKESRFPPIMGSGIRGAFRLPNKGSGIFVVGFMERKWKEATKRSIACNFFTAIHERKLHVVVDGEEITHETLNAVDFGDRNRRHYYDIIKNSGRPDKISGKFGSFELKVSVGDDSMGNRIAYVNRRGMLITDEKAFRKNPFHARLGEAGRFAAVLRATDDKTDERVRRMEPPTHETIEYERLRDPEELNEAENQLRAIGDMIFDRIKKKLNIDVLANKTELTELADIIPLFSKPDKGGNAGGSTTEPSKEIGVRVMPIPKNRISPPMTPGGDEEEPEEQPGGEGGAGGKGGASKNGPKPKWGPGNSNIDGMRVMRHGDMLRVAFTPKVGAVRFAVKPAGEENKAEDIIPVTAAKNAAHGGAAPILRKNVITVNAKRNQRVVLELSIHQGDSYTGYTVVEYEAVGRKR